MGVPPGFENQSDPQTFLLKRSVSPTAASITTSASGFIVSSFLYPLDVLRVRLQNRSQFYSFRSGFFNELSAVVTQTRKTGGFRGFYTGFWVGSLIPTVSWASHTFVLKILNQEAEKRGFNPSLLLNGVIAGVAMTCLINPIVLVKVRMQTSQFMPDLTQDQLRQKPRIIPTIQAIYKPEGLKGFSRGILPGLLLSPHAAIHWALFESSKNLYFNIIREDATV